MTRPIQITAFDGESLVRLPDNAVLLVTLMGDSTAAGWAAANADVRSALPGGATTLAECSIWNKWDQLTTAGGSLRLVNADDGTDWTDLTNAHGVNASGGGAFIGPEFGICYAARERMRNVIGTGVSDVRIVKFAVSSTGMHENFIPANQTLTWSPRNATANTKYKALVDYYLEPAVTHLLAAGKRVFVDGLYMSIGGGDGLDPASGTYAGWPACTSYAASLRTFHEQLAVDFGLASLPITIARTANVESATYLQIPRIRAAQDQYVLACKSPAAIIESDDLERQVDGLHPTGEGALSLGLRMGHAAPTVWQEITAAPAR